MSTKYMSMKHANSLTMLEQDIMRALHAKDITKLDKLTKAFPERVKRAIAFLVWRKLITKGGRIMFQVQTKNENGEWGGAIHEQEYVTRGDAMNRVDVLFHSHNKDARALEDGKPFYSREQGKSNARKNG